MNKTAGINYFYSEYLFTGLDKLINFCFCARTCAQKVHSGC